MSKGGQESKIPILGKTGGGRSLSRLASLSNKVRAHLSAESKLRPGSGMFLSFLGQNTRKRPSGFYQPLQEFCHKSEGCSPEEEGVSAAHIGRRVIASGSKVGVLRYYGSCNFAEGLWCGIELDSEDGEHDGAVKGVRYFSCPPRRGHLVPEPEVALVPQVRYISEVSSSGPHSLLGIESQSSTPGSPPLSSRHSSSAGSLIPKTMDLPSKHSSFELDESLGILTPDQMSDFTLNCPLERSPSAEELSSFMLQDVEFSDMALDSTDKRNSMEIKDEIKDDKLADLPPDTSEMSESLHSKKTDILSASSSARSKKDSRVDRTPSLEDLPLDSAGETSTEKTESFEVKSRAPNSFITSITSITSLDNGYQGDGEWSRPASRGPEHSPSGKGRSVKSRLDPMTDSDFFTESDADMAEEWGHRRAQVIDGTLYGVQPGLGGQGQIQRFSPSNEEMDSSGIYSDLEKRPEDNGWIKEEEDDRPLSPEGSIRTVSSKSDQSLKKISPTSFSSLIEQQVNTIKNLMAMEVQEQVEEVKVADSTTKDNTEVKKFKAPKRNVVSKIKIMISSSNTRKDEDQENRAPSRPVKKGRWDAVMNKIAQGQAEEKTNPKLKEVKSKVFSGMAVPKNAPPTGRLEDYSAGSRKAPCSRGLSSAQSISTRSLRDITTIKSKSRRTRIRSSESSLQGAPCSQASSRNSSVSDLSQPKQSPSALCLLGSGKKRDARCTSPQSDGSTNSVASQVTKKAVVTPPRPKTPTVGKNVKAAEKTPLVRKTTPRRGTVGPQHKPQPLRSEFPSQSVQSRLSAYQNRSGSATRCLAEPKAPTRPPQLRSPQPDPAALQHAAKGAQALAVLVHHLVYNLDAFSSPQLRKDLEKIKSKWLRSQLELEELKVSFNRLQEEYIYEKSEKEKELEDVENNHRCEVEEMHDKYKEEMDKLTRSFEQSMNELQRKFELKEKRLSKDLEKQLVHAEEAHISEKVALQERCKKLEELEGKVKTYEEAQRYFEVREAELLQQVEDMRGRYENLKEGMQISAQNAETKAKLSKRTSSCSSLQAEVDSLQCVLELRSTELQELRRQCQVWKRDAEQLPAVVQRVSTLTARVADLQAQIARKEEIEKQLQQEKQILSDTIAKESTQKKRISLQNEELQWKLKQNSLVFNALAGISSPSSIKNQKTPNRTSKSRSNRSSYELNKTASEADINLSRLSMCEKSPPGSPTVKSVIEKTDSVSWVLDMEEPPECVASRILRKALRSRSIGSPNTPHLGTSPLKVSWEAQAEAENITEEVIMVKGIGGSEVLELLSVDDSEIFIDDLPKRIKSEEEAEMLRRVGEMTERPLPKDSAGEAMISGEASDDEAPSESEEDTTSSGLSEDNGTRLFRLNGASDSGSLNMSWSEEVDILPSEG
ncbi:restin homolog isoform X5 [Halyomorpha halys]|uniref:restin homolog isoform X5 n=1 Tax=Halyomorpha halys TaxID=286706 RepID=UPI0006D4EE9D